MVSATEGEAVSMTILLARTPRPSRCGGGGGVGRGVVKDESDCMLWILWARAGRWEVRRLEVDVAI